MVVVSVSIYVLLKATLQGGKIFSESCFITRKLECGTLQLFGIIQNTCKFNSNMLNERKIELLLDAM